MTLRFLIIFLFNMYISGIIPCEKKTILQNRHANFTDIKVKGKFPLTRIYQ